MEGCSVSNEIVAVGIDSNDNANSVSDEISASVTPAVADTLAFDALDATAQGAVREAQRLRKEARRAAKEAKKRNAAAAPEGEPDYPTTISLDDYHDACPNGLFRDPNLPPTEAALALLLRALDAGDEQAAGLQRCQYFQFSSRDEDALWDARFNARLAWEGFFTITGRTRGRNAPVEPLPELQPFYGVLTWPNFESAKHVRHTLAKLSREPHKYVLRHNVDPERTWKVVEAYHTQQNGSNWLTRRYFDMMQEAHAVPSINFSLHCVELFEAATGGDEGAATVNSGEGAEEHSMGGGAPASPEIAVGGRVRIDGLSSRADLNGTVATVLSFDDAAGRWAVRCEAAPAAGELVRVRPSNLTALPPPPEPLAGEIGFSIGRVYTSLSGWTGERSTRSVGTAQLVLLGRLLQRRGYAFWSLGHCYSPHMDYKRQLGHRIYPRQAFRELLALHRGEFDVAAAATHDDHFVPLRCGESVEASALLGECGAAGSSAQQETPLVS
jgi:hypothetical protein